MPTVMYGYLTTLGPTGFPGCRMDTKGNSSSLMGTFFFFWFWFDNQQGSHLVEHCCKQTPIKANTLHALPHF